MARRRTCGECGKPLGGSLAYCHDCGGEDTGTDSMGDVWGPQWKLRLGVPAENVFAHHDKDTYYER